MNKLQQAERLVDAFGEGTLNKMLEVDSLVESTLTELNDYQKFFVAKLKAFGKPIGKMTEDEKSEFFSSIKTGWAAEKNK
ncbi:hypothetical protein KAR91_21970 [Candidatus Pacearchaeota archaeon]|nr:hypothetical protein [Candidatus Pacearchaeota archaeon]